VEADEADIDADADGGEGGRKAPQRYPRLRSTRPGTEANRKVPLTAYVWRIAAISNVPPIPWKMA
jgi:hypothetical protein